MVIRAYQPFDAAPLAALFYQTVHTVNRRDYTEKQLDAWAPKDIDLRAWDRSLQAHHTLVAVEDSCAVGFGDIDSNTGYLDRLYVHKDHQGMGIATALCDRLEASAAGPLVTHASLTARSFFEKKRISGPPGPAGGTPGDSSDQLSYGENTLMESDCLGPPAKRNREPSVPKEGPDGSRSFTGSLPAATAANRRRAEG